MLIIMTCAVNTHMERVVNHVLNVLIVSVVIVWIWLTCGCATSPAKQQKISTSDPTPHITTVDQIDLNRDGLIDSHELHNISNSTPDTLITFLCIIGLVIVLSVVCMWWHTRSICRSDTLHITPPDTPASPVKSVEPSDHWPHAEQDFLGDRHTPAHDDWLSADQTPRD